MTKNEASQIILVNSAQCHGCLTCQLRCSLRACGAFNLSKASIKVNRVEGEYTYSHSFTEECDYCEGDYLCVRWCSYGALSLGRR